MATKIKKKLSESNSINKLLTNVIGKPTQLDAKLITGRYSLSDDDKILIKKIGTNFNSLRELLNRQSQVNFERLAIYREMDRALLYPLIGSAMEMYSEYATNYSSLHSASVWVTSTNKKYASLLNNMLENIGIEEKIFDWAYTCAAYGDMFIGINAQPGVGIVSISDSDHPINISRVDYNGRLVGFYETPMGTNESERRILPPWQYVHMRLLGVKKKRPLYADPAYSEYRSLSIICPENKQLSSAYGTSLALNALPIYKRLRLAEDSLMLARLSKGILKYVYKVKVDGCFRGDTKIKLLDGTSPTIKYIVDNIGYFKGRSILTINPDTKQLQASRIVAGQLTHKNATLVRVYLDNQKYVDCTPNHRFMMRDGNYKEAIDLKENDSLMPYYERGGHYTAVYNPATCCFNNIHRIVMGDVKDGYVIHHRDFNGNNNDISNLVVVSEQEHKNIHFISPEWKVKISKGIINAHVSGKYNHLIGKPKSNRFRYNVSKGLKKAFKDGKLRCDNRKGLIIIPRIEVECECGCGNKFVVRVTDNRRFYSWKCYKRWCIDNNKPTKQAMEALKQSHIGQKPWNYGLTKDTDARVAQYGRVYSEKYAGFKNHKVVKVEVLNECADVYDIQVEDNANFPLEAGVFVHNSNMEAVAEIMDEYKATLKRARALDTTPGAYNFDEKLMEMAVNEDVLIPVWGDVNDLQVEKLGGDSDIRWITDIEELRNQLSSALRVPLQLLGGYTKDLPSSLGQSSLERLDIRFARSARRLQRAIISSITRLCQIHLAYQNMAADANMFAVNMSETSTAEEEELKDSLDKGTDIVDKLSDMVVKHLGDDVDKVALLDYLNQKVLKLNDIHFADLIKKVDDNTKKPVPESTGSSNLENGIFNRNRVLNNDIYAALPNVKKDIITEGKKTTIYINSDWEKTYGNTKVNIGKVEGTK